MTLDSKTWTTPVSIKKSVLKNRIAFPPLSGNWAEDDGSVSMKILRFYEDIARGGVGMIVVSGSAVSEDGKGSNNSLCFYKSSHLPGYQKLTETIKKKNCFVVLQLMHVGGQGNPDFTGSIPLSPSGLECKALGFETRELSNKEIIEVRGNFINSTMLALKAGFHGVELHLAHGYLLHEFISEHTNKRKDEYGGSMENRIRLVIEIIEEIKGKAPEFVLGVRISGEDYLEDGINKRENEKILPLLQEAGVDYFSVTAGIYETSKCKHESMERGEFFEYSHGIKSIVSKPVIGVGKVLDLAMAEEHLQREDCDIIAIGRGLVADPMMIEKVINGEDFNICTECGECQYMRFGKKELNCPFNEVTYL